jgi:hypothetical protein
MANEVSVSVNLAVLKTSTDGLNTTLIDYQSRPTFFKADMASTKGPVQGAVSVGKAGAALAIGEIINFYPSLWLGFARLTNQDPTNTVLYGVGDTTNNRFYSWGELGPGQTVVCKLSRFLNVSVLSTLSTGTGAAGPNNQLYLKTISFTDPLATANVLVEVFAAP